jgi:hypothetical protein
MELRMKQKEFCMNIERVRIIGAILFAVLALAGCSTKASGDSGSGSSGSGTKAAVAASGDAEAAPAAASGGVATITPASDFDYHVNPYRLLANNRLLLLRQAAIFA